MTRPLQAVSASILCAALLLQTRVDGIVIRHDVPDSEYRVGASAFPALAYLPGEGYGVLIARDWVVTATHATTWRPIHELTINGVVCGVEKVIIHPGYKSAPKETPLEDAAPLMTFLAGSDDIALIKPQHVISDVTPIPVYRDLTRTEKWWRLSEQDQPETDCWVNIRARLIAANCAVVKRESQVPMNVG